MACPCAQLSWQMSQKHCNVLECVSCCGAMLGRKAKLYKELMDEMYLLVVDTVSIDSGV